MNFDLHMPFWAILYCGFIFANSILTVIIAQNRSIVYMISQLLSSAFAISFFFIYYGVIQRPDNRVLTIMLLFILFHEIWINRELYNRFIFDQIPPQERDFALISIGIILIIFLLPFFYIIVQIFNN